MKKIKNIYLITDAGTVDGLSSASQLTGKNYATGLVLESADGKLYAQLSTDAIRPFEEVESTKTLAQLIIDIHKVKS